MSEPLIFNYDETAARMGKPVSADWLQKNKHRLPHCQFGDKVGFTEAHMLQIAEMQTVLPGQEVAPAEQVTPLPKAATKAVQNLKPRGASKQSA